MCSAAAAPRPSTRRQRVPDVRLVVVVVVIKHDDDNNIITSVAPGVNSRRALVIIFFSRSRVCHLCPFDGRRLAERVSYTSPLVY